MDFDEVAGELFGLAPADFIRVRDARAKAARAAGDRELATRITALRKPTNVAWLANQLARERPEQVKLFLALAQELREATASLRGPALRELSRQRHKLVQALVAEARTLATGHGPRTTEDLARGLEETLHAALADPDGAKLFAAGRLSTSLRHGGFGGPPSLPPPAPPSEGATRAVEGRDVMAAERRSAERQVAEETLAHAMSEGVRAAERRDATAVAVGEVNQAYDAATALVQELEKQLLELQRTLEEAGQARERTRRARADARAAHDQASQESDEARRVVTDLQVRLDSL